MTHETTRAELTQILSRRARDFYCYLAQYPVKVFPKLHRITQPGGHQWKGQEDAWDFPWDKYEAFPTKAVWTAPNQLEFHAGDHGVIRFKGITVSDIASMEVGPLLITNEKPGDTAISKVINDGTSPVERTVTQGEEDETQEMRQFQQELNTRMMGWFKVGNETTASSGGMEFEVQVNLQWQQQSLSRKLKSFEGETKVIIPPHSRAEISIVKNICDAKRTVTLTGRLDYELEAESPGNLKLSRTLSEWENIMSGVGTVDSGWSKDWWKGGGQERKYVEGHAKHIVPPNLIRNFLRHREEDRPTVTISVTREMKAARAADIQVKTETLAT